MGCTNQKIQSNPICKFPDQNKSWFDQVHVGDIKCKNRIFMASMTRLRGTSDGLATQLVKIYYSQRTEFGLIFTESSPVSQQGIAYLGQVCLFNQRQCDEWKTVVNAVHEKGGVIVIQVFFFSFNQMQKGA